MKVNKTKTKRPGDDMLFVRVPPPLKKKLDARAAELSRELGLRVTRSDVVRRVLEEKFGEAK